MIHSSIVRHVRRLIASAVLFGSAVMLMLWLPIQILKTLWPMFLPYTLSGDSEVNELSLQLLLLQVSGCNFRHSAYFDSEYVSSVDYIAGIL